MPEQLTQFIEMVFSNPLWVGLLITLSALTFIGSLILLPWLILRLPEDYFIDDQRHLSGLHQRHPLVYTLLRVSKNLLGVLILLAGIIMLVLPGQGLLAMLIGISLVDFPGKYQFERAIIRRPSVNNVINWIREKGNKPPLKIP